MRAQQAGQKALIPAGTLAGSASSLSDLDTSTSFSEVGVISPDGRLERTPSLCEDSLPRAWPMSTPSLLLRKELQTRRAFFHEKLRIGRRIRLGQDRGDGFAPHVPVTLQDIEQPLTLEVVLERLHEVRYAIGIAEARERFGSSDEAVLPESCAQRRDDLRGRERDEAGRGRVRDGFLRELQRRRFDRSVEESEGGDQAVTRLVASNCSEGFRRRHPGLRVESRAVEQELHESGHRSSPLRD